jgi:hypothetical protein
MNKLTKLSCVIGATLLLFSCATSMSPVKVNNTLPALTKSRFVPQSKAKELVSTGSCQCLTNGRSYAAPVGLTNKHDLRNAAKGIDEWVNLDGGNAYVLVGYKWVTVDHYGSTQLHVDFDTMLCE